MLHFQKLYIIGQDVIRGVCLTQEINIVRIVVKIVACRKIKTLENIELS